MTLPPRTEAGFLALGETDERVELIDGKLHATPRPRAIHQLIVHGLFEHLRGAAEAAGLSACFGIDVRIGPGRIVAPDVIVGKLALDDTVPDARDVILVCEVTSAGSASYDRTTKKRLYAEAGVEWYLIAEPGQNNQRTVSLRLHRLEGAGYAEFASATFGGALISEHPFPIEIPTTTLTRP